MTGSPKFLVHERWFSSVCNTIDMVWSRFDFSPHTAHTMPQHTPLQKPPAHICPQQVCFFWQERGDFAAPGLYPSLADVLRTMHEIERSGCGCPFEQCVRDPDGSGPINWYEPCEPALAEAGLPWFYFTPGPHTLIPELYSQGRLETNQENAIFSSPFQLTSELTIDDDEIILVIPHDADLFFSYMEHD